ncbi:hypothetical protein BDZ97DRAFT_1821044 [Flammula alnicola]|nr:hypothetical protein BDZ97DRAFT_1821044 [Flammula alnicola]
MVQALVVVRVPRSSNKMTAKATAPPPATCLDREQPNSATCLNSRHTSFSASVHQLAHPIQAHSQRAPSPCKSARDPASGQGAARRQTSPETRPRGPCAAPTHPRRRLGGL